MTLATNQPISISNQDFQTMLSFIRSIYKLKNNSRYVNALEKTLPKTAKKESLNPSLLMGYDFHLTKDGPKLIEINNNAGGLFEKDDGWIPQSTHSELNGSLKQRILQMFPENWQHIAIMDEDITEQYMFPEMKAYAALLVSEGRKVSLVAPKDLTYKTDGLYVQEDKVDGIYNRHTDFYFNTVAMQHIHQAFMLGQVEVNPYPRSYALIGDKNRMVDWWRENLLDQCVDTKTMSLIRGVVPETHLLAEYAEDEAWSSRKSWVFKPAARHGGKGVLLGKAMSRKRFAQLDIQTTVMQKLVPPSQIEINNTMYKFDIRIYMHGTTLIAMAGRAWNGQITNFREEGSGWTAIQVKS